MKALLEDIKARLLAEVSGLGVEIAPEDTYLPDYAKLPWAGLRAGGLVRVDLAGGLREETLTVKVLVYAENQRSPEAMTTAGLDAMALVDAALAGWAPDGYILGGDMTELATAPAMRGENGPFLQRVALTYQYVREV
ncbi:MAG: hypothetical protein AB1896_07255 [Thermodesulfobacteriota bacterium]